MRQQHQQPGDDGYFLRTRRRGVRRGRPGPSSQDQPEGAGSGPRDQPLVAGILAGSGPHDQPVLIAGSGPHDQPVLVTGSGKHDQPVLIAGSDPQDQPVLVGILKKKAKTTFTWPDIHRIKQQPCHSFP